MIDYIETDFRRRPVFDKCACIGSHSDVGVIELMPTSDGQEYGFKYVNGRRSNPASGHQTVTAFGVLADVATGYPTFWSGKTELDAEILTMGDLFVEFPEQTWIEGEIQQMPADFPITELWPSTRRTKLVFPCITPT